MIIASGIKEIMSRYQIVLRRFCQDNPAFNFGQKIKLTPVEVSLCSFGIDVRLTLHFSMKNNMLYFIEMTNLPPLLKTHVKKGEDKLPVAFW